jgi:uncharacterized surface protein with fasciclin (FAS1) repeats
VVVWTLIDVLSCYDAVSGEYCKADSNIVEIAVSQPDFSTLVAAVQAANLTDALSAEGPLDVFAPTNEAFANALAALGITAEELLGQTELLQQILAYHVVASGASCDMPLMGAVETLLPGNTLTVEGSTVTDGNGGTANILGTVPAKNGQIFIIDSVLLPAPAPAAPAME